MGKIDAVIYTIGHSNHPLDGFLGLLKQHRISDLVDVRSRPYSRWFPHFNKSRIEGSLREAGIGYHFSGNHLGGKPNDPALYDGSGNARYDLIAAGERYQDAVQDVLNLASGSRLALMCAEENPRVCHRHLLVGRTLSERDITMLHIRRDGEIQRDDEI